jgi:hypothetical protein
MMSFHVPDLLLQFKLLNGETLMLSKPQQIDRPPWMATIIWVGGILCFRLFNCTYQQ